jgi:ribosomal protein S1
MKPGFNVSGKVSKIYENGVEITFLGGITATCFVDHLQEDISEYKLGKKVIARIISVDTIAKKITVSMLNSIVNWNIHKPEYKIGETICKAKIAKKIYGGSFLVDFSNGSGFLHKT